MIGEGKAMGDIGTWMVDNLYQQLMVDDEWAVRRERGFTWWSHRLAQHIDVAPPVHDDGLDLCILRIWTDAVAGVDPASDPAVILSQLNSQATLNALVWNPRDATISECCTVTVHQDKMAVEVLNLLEQHRIDDLIVVNDQQAPVGMVDSQDLTKLKLL